MSKEKQNRYSSAIERALKSHEQTIDASDAKDIADAVVAAKDVSKENIRKFIKNR